MEINNCETIREAVVHGLGISFGAETEFGSDRQLRWLSVSDAEIYIELNLVWRDIAADTEYETSSQ